MAKILIGTPSIHIDLRFLESLPQFYKDLSKNHRVDHTIVYGRSMVDAQNEIANRFVDGDWDYLLLLEDDHWGFTAEMVDKLISIDWPITTICSFTRYFPYWCVPMRYKSNEDGTLGAVKSYKHIYESGIHEADMIGMYFCLMNRELFDKLSRPYFTSDNPANRQTDRIFCRRLKDELGLLPKACFDYVLPHRDITKDNVENKRLEFIKMQRDPMNIHKMKLENRRKGELQVH